MYNTNLQKILSNMHKILPFLLFFSMAICACTQGNGLSSENETYPILEAAWPETPDIASYDIQVTLDTKAKTLSGHETITYHNTTSIPIPDVVLHLYLNAFRDKNSLFFQEIGGTHRGFSWDPESPGQIEVSSIHLTDGTPLTLELLEDSTLARATLPEAIPPGSDLSLEVDFEALLPKVFVRTGFYEDFFMVGQWFPKLGVWQPEGWNAHPFHANAEFFADFGSYDVAITLPSDYVTGGIGLPTNAQEHGDGTQTVSYHAEGVIDFSWTASPDFKQTTRDVNGVQILYLYLPEHDGTIQRVLNAAEVAVKHFSEWYGPYPYARLTIVDVPDDGSGAGGMEYPTLITAGAFDPSGLGILGGPFDKMLEVVIIHEIGHQWWQSMVAFNEAEEPWLDEGFTDYSTARLMHQVYGPHGMFDAGNLEMNYTEMHRMMYLVTPRVPMYGKAWEFETFESYEVGAYSKPILALLTLENTLGAETMLDIMHTFFQKYKFTHPTTDDFRQVAEETSGQDLTWFFDGIVHSDEVVNYTVSAVNTHSVTVERQGNLVIPTEIEITFRDGSTQIIQWDGQETKRTWEFPETISEAKIDPKGKNLLDLQWSDNGLKTRMDLWSGLAISTRFFYQIQNWLLYLGGL